MLGSTADTNSASVYRAFGEAHTSSSWWLTRYPEVDFCPVALSGELWHVLIVVCSPCPPPAKQIFLFPFHDWCACSTQLVRLLQHRKWYGLLESEFRGFCWFFTTTGSLEGVRAHGLWLHCRADDERHRACRGVRTWIVFCVLAGKLDCSRCSSLKSGHCCLSTWSPALTCLMSPSPEEYIFLDLLGDGSRKMWKFSACSV